MLSVETTARLKGINTRGQFFSGFKVKSCSERIVTANNTKAGRIETQASPIRLK
jgi:hypothetical protein